MKVLYDHQIFSYQKYGGISRYFYELIKYFQGRTEVSPELSVLYSNNHYLKSDPEIKLAKKTVLTRVQKYSHQLNYLNSIKAITSENYDLFHPTYYDTYFLNYIRQKPFVITVYDLIHELFPEHFSLTDLVFQNKKQLARLATGIIAISQNTKKDLIELFDIPESKITVVYLGSSFKVTLELNKKTGLQIPERYLLFVGNRTAYKNFYFLISSLAKILVEDHTLYLVCAGGGEFSKEEKQFFKVFGVTAKILYYEADNESLTTLYQNALAFIYPSLYEGFGIPLLEAFNCGCPVIAGNNSSLKEIGEDAVLYIDPKGVSSVRERVTTLLSDDLLRKELRERGLKQAAKFSWEKCARETELAYEKALVDFKPQR